MKKFKFTSLLILVLVLVLSLSMVLVACNKDKGGAPDDEEICEHVDENGDWLCDKCGANLFKKDQYFTKLWALSKSIGADEITEDDNFCISADISIALDSCSTDTKTKKVTVESNTLALGIALDVVYDRTGANTAARAKVYNAIDNSNLFTVYYFLNEANYVYFQIGADNYKVAFDTDGENNGTYAQSVSKFIKENEVLEGVTIEDIINGVINNTGSDWTLNDLVDGITSIFGLDLGELLKKFNTSSLGTPVDKEGKIHIENLLGSQTIKGILETPSVKINQDGSKEYKMGLKLSSLMGILKSLVTLPDAIGQFLNDKTTLTLVFGEKNNDINGFSIIVGEPAMADKDGLWPQLTLSINTLKLKKVASADKIPAMVNFNAADFTKVDAFDINAILCGYCSADVVWTDQTAKAADPIELSCEAYSDVDIIKTIIKIVDMVKAENAEARVAAFKEIGGEIAFQAKVTEAANGYAAGDIYAEFIVSCEDAKIYAIWKGVTYIIDIADLFTNGDTMIESILSDFSIITNAFAAADEEGPDFMGIISAIPEALELIQQAIKFNGKTIADIEQEELEKQFLVNGKTFDDVLEAIIGGEDVTELINPNWWTFTLTADFTAQVNNNIAKLFGGANDSNVDVKVVKEKNALNVDVKWHNGKFDYKVDVDIAYRVDEESNLIKLVDVSAFWQAYDPNADAQDDYLLTIKLNNTISDKLITKLDLEVELKSKKTTDADYVGNWFKVDGTCNVTYFEGTTEIESLYGPLTVSRIDYENPFTTGEEDANDLFDFYADLEFMSTETMFGWNLDLDETLGRFLFSDAPAALALKNDISEDLHDGAIPTWLFKVLDKVILYVTDGESIDGFGGTSIVDAMKYRGIIANDATGCNGSDLAKLLNYEPTLKNRLHIEYSNVTTEDTDSYSVGIAINNDTKSNQMYCMINVVNELKDDEWVLSSIEIKGNNDELFKGGESGIKISNMASTQGLKGLKGNIRHTNTATVVNWDSENVEALVKYIANCFK